jgi:hypothetical protein
LKGTFAQLSSYRPGATNLVTHNLGLYWWDRVQPNANVQLVHHFDDTATDLDKPNAELRLLDASRANDRRRLDV